MSASIQVGGDEAIVDTAQSFRQCSPRALRSRRWQRVPESRSSFAFAHINGISDKLQSMAVKLAVDDAVRSRVSDVQVVQLVPKLKYPGRTRQLTTSPTLA
jgi:hypothetical protein